MTRKRRPVAIITLLLIALTVFRAWPSAAAEEIAVPQLLNYLVDDAVALAQRAGLKVEVRRDRVVTDPRLYNRVYKQEPRAAKGPAFRRHDGAACQ